MCPAHRNTSGVGGRSGPAVPGKGQKMAGLGDQAFRHLGDLGGLGHWMGFLDVFLAGALGAQGECGNWLNRKQGPVSPLYRFRFSVLRPVVATFVLVFLQPGVTQSDVVLQFPFKTVLLEKTDAKRKTQKRGVLLKT